MTQTLIRENQALLVRLGVSHPALEMVVAATASEPFGLATKLTGAGGGGCAVTLIPDGTFLHVAESRSSVTPRMINKWDRKPTMIDFHRFPHNLVGGTTGDPPIPGLPTAPHHLRRARSRHPQAALRFVRRGAHAGRRRGDGRSQARGIAGCGDRWAGRLGGGLGGMELYLDMDFTESRYDAGPFR